RVSGVVKVPSAAATTEGLGGLSSQWLTTSCRLSGVATAGELHWTSSHAGPPTGVSTKPRPETVTVWPSARPLLGVTVTVWSPTSESGAAAPTKPPLVVPLATTSAQSPGT